MQSVQVALWGIAAVAPVAIAYRYHRLPVLGLATMLVLGWCVGRLAGAFWEAPDGMRIYPLMDAVFGALAFMAWRHERAWWKLVLVGLFLGQSALHAAFWLAYPPNGYPPEVAGPILYRYVVANNVLFACELLCVAWAGGLDEWGRSVRHYLSGRPDPFRHVGPPR